MAKFRKWDNEKPQPFRLIVIRDANGTCDGHLSARIVYDGKNVTTDVGHAFRADTGKIVDWCYLEDIWKN